MNKIAMVLVGLFISVLFANSKSWAVNFDKAVPPEVQKQMVEDLAFMGQLEGSSQTPFHKQVFGNLTGTSYKTFFETRITSIGMNSCGGGNAVACVIPYLNPKKMWLTQNFVKFSHPQVARSMVVYHEARHSESAKSNWPHDTCPTPFLDEQGKDKSSIWTGVKLEGQPACDSTPFGSYGSSTIMLKNISKFCTNCTDKIKMDANIYATDQLGRIDDAQAKQSMIADFNAN